MGIRNRKIKRYIKKNINMVKFIKIYNSKKIFYLLMIIDRRIIKGMGKDSTIVISFSIAMFLLLVLLLLVTYNSKCQMDNSENFNDLQVYNNSVATNANKNVNFDLISSGIGDYKASEPSGDETYNAVSVNQNKEMYPQCSDNNDYACVKRDNLTSQDLLPSGADSKWAILNPLTPSNFTDQSYLNAGHHIGIDTVGQSLRNANLQLRAEPPNPQVAVSPWGISTIEPDNYSRGLMDIGPSPVLAK